MPTLVGNPFCGRSRAPDDRYQGPEGGMPARRGAAAGHVVPDGVAHRFSAGEREPGDAGDLSSPTYLAENLRLPRSYHEAQISASVNEAFAKNPQAVQDTLSNAKNRKAVGGLLAGQVMKHSGGKADPKIVARLIENTLAQMVSRGWGNSSLTEVMQRGVLPAASKRAPHWDTWHAE